MTWNYRVVKRKHAVIKTRNRKAVVEYSYAIHEVYYHKNKKGKWEADMMTREPVQLVGESLISLRTQLDMMKKDFLRDAPVLDYDHPPWKKKKRKAKARVR